MRISVALCTYNGCNFIKEQLQSILDQSIRPHEIIVCDDGSTDNTVQIIKAFQERHPGLIEMHINEKNLHVNKNFEKAIKLCTGDYIFLSDQDDRWKKEKVERTLAIFNSNPQLEAVFSNAELIDDFGTVQPGSLWENVLFLENYISEKITLYFYLTRITNMVTGAALCIRKEAKLYIFPFPGKSYVFHDEWIALVLTIRNTIAYTTEKLFSYRLHASQEVGVMSKGSLKRKLKIAKMATGQINEGTFSELILLRKIYFRNYNKFTMLKNTHAIELNIDMDKVISESKEAIKETEKRMKRKNILGLYLVRWIDKLRGKRQFNEKI